MPEPTSTPKAARTRRDIVVAAIDCWSLDNTASLGEVAATAGVGRTTLNRYFADRSELVEAVDAECRSRYAAAVDRARPDRDSGLAALLRICTELMQVGGVLALTFADNAVVDPDRWYADGTDPLGIVLERGLTDGSIADDLPGAWVATFVWTTLFAGSLLVKTGEATVHEAAQLLVRTLTSAIEGRSEG